MPSSRASPSGRHVTRSAACASNEAGQRDSGATGASVTVIDSDAPYNYVELRGRVTTMEEDVGRATAVWQYDGRDPDADRPGAVRLIVRMPVDKATGYAA